MKDRVVDLVNEYAGVTAAVLILTAIAAIVYTGFGLPWGASQVTVDDSVCEQEFGDGYTYSGYMAGNPPVIICSGPDGMTGYMDMPQEIAERHNINASAYYNQTE